MNGEYDENMLDRGENGLCACCADVKNMYGDKHEATWKVCMYTVMSIFSLFVRIVCYVGGFIAPFAILFCW